MALGFRGSLRTSSAPQHPPFKVEVANNRDILCYVGRVVEKKSSEEFGQLSQKSWDATLSKITSKGLPNTRNGRVELKYHNFNVLTGSANIHYTGGSVASQGRSDFASATQVVSDKGYVKWARSAGPLHNYIILHREIEDEETPEIGKWCISAVGSEDITESDIVIAYINNGTTVRQIWKSDVFHLKGPETTVEPFVEDHPWKVWNTGSSTHVDMTAGSVDNVLPMAGAQRVTLPLSVGNPLTLFYLICFFNGTTIVSAVVTPSPTVIGHTETTGSILLASVTVSGTGLQIVQYCKNSLWAERFKCAQQPVEYWFSTT